MRVLWFICLKVVEISGIVFIPYYAGMGSHRWLCDAGSKCPPLWVEGILVILLLMILLVSITGILLMSWGLLKLNWGWAQDLQYKFKR